MIILAKMLPNDFLEKRFNEFKKATLAETGMSSSDDDDDELNRADTSDKFEPWLADTKAGGAKAAWRAAVQARREARPGAPD